MRRPTPCIAGGAAAVGIRVAGARRHAGPLWPFVVLEMTPLASFGRRAPETVWPRKLPPAPLGVPPPVRAA